MGDKNLVGPRSPGENFTFIGFYTKVVIVSLHSFLFRFLSPDSFTNVCGLHENFQAILIFLVRAKFTTSFPELCYR